MERPLGEASTIYDSYISRTQDDWRASEDYWRCCLPGLPAWAVHVGLMARPNPPWWCRAPALQDLDTAGSLSESDKQVGEPWRL
jgi:hypothetical protein